MKSKVVFVLSVLLAAYFGLNGILKLTMHPHMVESFTRWGYGRTWLFVIGATELAAGAALLFRPTSRAAGVVLGAVMVGATFTHLTHAEWAHALIPIVVLPLVVSVAFARGGGLPAWLRARLRAS